MTNACLFDVFTEEEHPPELALSLSHHVSVV